MKTKLLAEGTQKIYAVVFDAGDEVIGGLESFAKEAGLDAAHFTALGAFERATLGYFDVNTQDYVRIPVDEQVEVLSLVGDVSLKGDKPQIHAHVVVGKRDGARRTHLGGVRPSDSRGRPERNARAPQTADGQRVRLGADRSRRLNTVLNQA